MVLPPPPIMQLISIRIQGGKFTSSNADMFERMKRLNFSRYEKLLDAVKGNLASDQRDSWLKVGL